MAGDASDSTHAHDPPTDVTVVGETTATVSAPTAGETADDAPLTSVEMGFSCDTGTSAAGTWRGRPLSALFDAVAMPGETTHVVLEAPDGFAVCVPATTALDGVLATTLDGEPLDDARTRFVAPGLGSTRCIRDVAVVRAVHLEPGEDRSDYESIGD